MAPLPRTPDLEAQRAAMRKLEFLIGKWAGEARIYRQPNEPIVLQQSEEAHFKLDGLLLLIEGTGRAKSDGAPALNALGIICYDDERSSYRMRAFNDGRFLETDVVLLEDGKSLRWGFALGEIQTAALLRVNDSGEWTEFHELAVGKQPARKFMELRVKRCP